MATNTPVLRSTEADYGDKFQDHILAMYHAYVSSAERISDRRLTSNSFFLAVNTALVGVAAYVAGTGTESGAPFFSVVVALGGAVLCYTWYRLIRSYKDLNSGKFKVVHDIEALLPLRPFDAEWDKLGRGQDPDLYLPFTKVEMTVPWVFLLLHVAAGAGAVWRALD